MYVCIYLYTHVCNALIQYFLPVIATMGYTAGTWQTKEWWSNHQSNEHNKQVTVNMAGYS